MLTNKYTKLVIVAGLVVLFDQISKALILKHLPRHHSRTIIAGFFDITHIRNPGALLALWPV
jgi:signal peptidase II